MTRPFDQRRILLGVTGGIAAYKSAWIARLLTQAGASVDVVLTRSAAEFIGAITFEALTDMTRAQGRCAGGHALDHSAGARGSRDWSRPRRGLHGARRERKRGRAAHHRCSRQPHRC